MTITKTNRTCLECGSRQTASNGDTGTNEILLCLDCGEQWFATIEEGCKVFLLCENPATTYFDHPTLGKVPACARCEAKMEAMEALS